MKRPRTGLAGIGPILLLAMLFLAPAAAGCGGSAQVCAKSDPLAPGEWERALAALNRSIELARVGQGQAASELFFTVAHDPLHKLTAIACETAPKASRTLEQRLERLHARFDPDDSAKLVSLLTAIRDSLPPVARAANLSVP